ATPQLSQPFGLRRVSYQSASSIGSSTRMRTHSVFSPTRFGDAMYVARCERLAVAGRPWRQRRLEQGTSEEGLFILQHPVMRKRPRSVLYGRRERRRVVDEGPGAVGGDDLDAPLFEHAVPGLLHD